MLLPAATRLCPEALLARDLSNRVYVVTGANSGIGLETARHLASRHAHVVLGCRRVSDAEARVAEIVAAHPGALLTVLELDLASLASVRAFAAAVSASFPAIDGLVNNAGVMNVPRGTTADGFETHIGVNHVGHFLLTELLAAAVAAAAGRVICLSSCAHDTIAGKDGGIVLDDLHFASRPYDGLTAYAQSKLANLLHARGIAKHHHGVTAVSVHPGIVETSLFRHTLPAWFLGRVMAFIRTPISKFIGVIQPWDGAQTTLYVLLAEEIEDGAFYSQVGMYTDKKLNGGGWPMVSPSPAAHDDAIVEGLWVKSCEMVGLGKTVE